MLTSRVHGPGGISHLKRGQRYCRQVPSPVNVCKVPHLKAALRVALVQLFGIVEIVPGEEREQQVPLRQDLVFQWQNLRRAKA